MPVIKRSRSPKIAVLSARVGSISDNRLGGWYSYRGNKAALNMMLKCAALELRQVNPQAKLMAYHPGPSIRPRPSPFQASVSAEKLLSPVRAAAALDNVLNGLEVDGDLAYLDWQGRQYLVGAPLAKKRLLVASDLSPLAPNARRARGEYMACPRSLTSPFV